jgi:predicted RNase H-like HicB family nuclease
MDLTVTFNRDETGACVVEVPAILTWVSQGKTRLAALKNARAAIQFCLAVRAERGLPLTIERTQFEVAVCCQPRPK